MQENLYPVDSIRPDPDQPRKDKPPEYLKELARSIAYKGLDNDGHIRSDPEGDWLVVNGECRWTAISLYLPGILQEMAKKGENPCMKGWYRDENGVMYMACKVKEYSGENVAADVFLDQIRDNEVRKNLGPVETLKAFKRAADEFNIPLTEMANALGKSVATLQGDLPILGLPKLIRKAFDRGDCTKAVARRLAELPDDENLRLRAWKRARLGENSEESVAKIDAYLKARKKDNGNKQQLFEWDAADPKWRGKAARAFNNWSGAINRFDETSYSNGSMNQLVKAKINELDLLELTAKAAQRQAANLLAECVKIRAEGNLPTQR